MRGATITCIIAEALQVVSIHAPHAGRDRIAEYRQTALLVSIHAPHAGRDRA